LAYLVREHPESLPRTRISIQGPSASV
jgi:hypothetical protein